MKHSLLNSRARKIMKAVIRAIAPDVHLVHVFKSLVLSQAKEDLIMVRNKKRAVSVLRVLVPAYRVVALSAAIVHVTTIIRKVVINHVHVNSMAKMAVISHIHANMVKKVVINHVHVNSMAKKAVINHVHVNSMARMVNTVASPVVVINPVLKAVMVLSVAISPVSRVVLALSVAISPVSRAALVPSVADLRNSVMATMILMRNIA